MVESITDLITLLVESKKTSSYLPICLTCGDREGSAGVSLKRGDTYYLQYAAAKNICRSHRDDHRWHVVVLATPDGNISAVY